MAQSLLSLLEELRTRIAGLKAEIESLRQKNRELEQENAELVDNERKALEKRDIALRDAEFLSMSHRLADSPDTIVETRRKIAGLIRNIDRCIEMLKE